MLPANGANRLRRNTRMTHPLSRWSRYAGANRPRIPRAAAAAAAAGVLAAALAPAATPASAAPDSCAGLGAAAAGDLIAIRLLDLRSLNASVPAVTNLTFAPTRAGFVGASGRTAAQAKYLQGSVAGLKTATGPLDATAYQLAPPNSPQPSVTNPGRLDLGVARVGTGDLKAAAQARGCDPDTRAGASAAMLDAAVLPGRQALLKAPDNLSSTARAGVVRHQGRLGAEATSTASVANVSMLGTLKVRVLSQPSLRAVAAGHKTRSTVEYSAPLLAIEVAGGGQVRLERAGASADFTVPVPGAAPVAGVPELSGGTLNDILGAATGTPQLLDLGGLLGGVTRTGAGAGAHARAKPDADADASPGAGGATGAGASARTEATTIDVPESAGSARSPVVPGLDALSGVPAVGGLLGGSGKLVAPEGGAAVVLRLTAGELSKSITNAGVHAKAITLRLKLFLVQGDKVVTLVDLAVGVLEVAATAPSGGYGGGGYGPDDDNGGVSADEPVAQPTPSLAGLAPKPPEARARLPRTGTALSLFVAAGVLLLIAGRFMMVLARRRLIA
jgi:hypothetical protein